MIFDAGIMGPHIKMGRLHALAVTSAKPSALVPGLPAIAESGLPGFETVSMTGMFAPIETPDAIVRRLNQEVLRVLSQPDVKAKFISAGIEVTPGTPEQFGSAVKTEMTNLAKVIKDANIKIE